MELETAVNYKEAFYQLDKGCAKGTMTAYKCDFDVGLYRIKKYHKDMIKEVNDFGLAYWKNLYNYALLQIVQEKKYWEVH